jgi:hypothetical protein
MMTKLTSKGFKNAMNLIELATGKSFRDETQAKMYKDRFARYTDDQLYKAARIVADTYGTQRNEQYFPPISVILKALHEVTPRNTYVPYDGEVVIKCALCKDSGLAWLEIPVEVNGQKFNETRVAACYCEAGKAKQKQGIASVMGYLDFIPNKEQYGIDELLGVPA